ncbi:MAG: CBS domain-containing protein [Thermomicrobiales bacterium]
MDEPSIAQEMRRDVPTVTPGDTVATVARLLVETGLPGIPVVRDGALVGIVTESDIVARQADVDAPAQIPFLDAVFRLDAGRSFGEELRHVLGVTVDDVMTHPVYSVTTDATIGQIATLMIDKHLNPVPILDAQHRIVGIVTRADLVRIIARLEDDGAERPAPAG